jgi:hypothetical protein
MYNLNYTPTTLGGTKLSGKASLRVRGEKRLNTTALEDTHLRRCVQKFPEYVDNEMNNNNKHLSRSNKKDYDGKLTRLTHKTAIRLLVVAESCTICSSRSRRQVRKLLDTPSYTFKFPTSETVHHR